MIAKLEFNLNEPGDKEDFILYQEAPTMKCLIEDIYKFIRTKKKYSELTPDQEVLIEELSDIFFAGYGSLHSQ
jgi:hypothetical protein